MIGYWVWQKNVRTRQRTLLCQDLGRHHPNRLHLPMPDSFYSWETWDIHGLVHIFLEIGGKQETGPLTPSWSLENLFMREALTDNPGCRPGLTNAVLPCAWHFEVALWQNEPQSGSPWPMCKALQMSWEETPCGRSAGPVVFSIYCKFFFNIMVSFVHFLWEHWSLGRGGYVDAMSALLQLLLASSLSCESISWRSFPFFTFLTYPCMLDNDNAW